MRLINVSLKTIYGRKIIEGLNLIINKNDKIALIGEEGNGKSTLLKYIYNPKLIEDYCFFNGTRDLCSTIGYLPQIIEAKWNQLGAQDYLLLDKPGDEPDYDIFNNINLIEKLFVKYRLDIDKFNSNQMISTLSGGEKIKLQLIKILYNNPSLILLDEPTNDLDLETIELLESFILNSNIPIIFISHDQKLLENTSNRILHLEQVKRKTEMKWTLENVGYKEYQKLRVSRNQKQDQEAYRTHKEYDEKKQILMRQHQLVENALNQAVRSPHEGRLLAKKMRNVLSKEKALEKMEIVSYYQPEEAINLFFDDLISIPSKKIIFKMENEELSVDNKLLATNLNLVVKGAEKITFIGNNGCGKTTLLKKIYNSLKEDKSISVGYMPQNYDEELSFELTPVSYLQSFLGYDKENKSKIMSCLGALNFVENEMNSTINNLSGGQKAKLYLLKLVLLKNDVLILDEPTRNLSPLSTPVIKKILSNFKGCIISSSHDRSYIEEVSTSIYKLQEDGLTKIDD